MDQIAASQSASARSLLYWLLAELFLNCPDERSVNRLRHDLASVPDDCGPLGQLNKLYDVLPTDSVSLNELAVEYTRLFGAFTARGGPRPPYESVERSPDASHAVERFYIETGLAPHEACAPPDHLGVELRFLALLYHREAEALVNRDWPEIDNCIRQQKAFLDRHILVWAPRYLDGIEGETHCAFYRFLANITAAALNERSEELRYEGDLRSQPKTVRVVSV